MRLHHTKNKGDLAVLKVQVDLYEQGYVCYTSVTEHQDFDLIAYKAGGVFKRIQVKYRSLSEKGTLDISLKQAWIDRQGTHSKEVNKEEIDLFAVYCPETNECYYFTPTAVNVYVSLRINNSKNNQQRNVKLAADYRRVP